AFQPHLRSARNLFLLLRPSRAYARRDRSSLICSGSSCPIVQMVQHVKEQSKNVFTSQGGKEDEKQSCAVDRKLRARRCNGGQLWMVELDEFDVGPFDARFDDDEPGEQMDGCGSALEPQCAIG